MTNSNKQSHTKWTQDLLDVFSMGKENFPIVINSHVSHVGNKVV